MKRFFDLILAVLLLIIFSIPMLFICGAVWLTSSGPILYWSNRVGKNNYIFRMPKFRSMRVEAPTVATNLLINPQFFFTPIGAFLRKSSLDELPQIWSILVGDMSFVGPRPALENQDDLIQMRTENNIHTLLPGLTGWAQVNGRDEISLEMKVQLDLEYMHKKSFLLDLYILSRTFFKVLGGDGVSH